MPTIGRYEVFGLLGAGGMATVHLGRLAVADRFSRVVAIKRLHAGLAQDPEHVAMLLDEARLAARVRHPNAAALLDVFEEAGEVVLVMEYVAGETLARIGGQAPTRIAAAIACDVLEALHAAHEARDANGKPLGLIHRDVSPQNVIVGADGLAHLLDFGIAKAAGRLHVTRDGAVKGKVGYMPPERLRGEPAARAADIYATAAVLWEMLAGRRLFDGETEAAAVVASLNGATDPPSTFAAAVPKALDDVVMRGLARLPHARFATARAMADALRAASEPAPPATVAEWMEEHASEALRGRRERVATIEAGRSSVVERAATTPGVAAAAPSSTGAPRGRRLRTIGGALAAAGLGAALVVLIGGRGHSRPEVGPQQGSADAAASGEGGSDDPAPRASSEDVPTGVSRGTPSTADSAPSAAPAVAGRASHVRVSPPPPKRDCDPPYTLEGRRKVFKPGCL